MPKKTDGKSSKKGGNTGTVRTSSFSVAKVGMTQNVGHASTELLDEMQEALQIKAKLNNQYILWGRLSRMSSKEIKDALELYFYDGGKLTGIYNSWPVIYSLRWKNLENPVRFHESSANCLYFFLPVETQNGQKHKLFMKIVDSMKVGARMLDNPLTDNMNGRIIHHICRDPDFGYKVSEHVMRYLCSFNSLILKDADGYRSWPITEITDIKNQICPFSKNFNVPSVDGVYMTSVFDTVDGISLSSALNINRDAVHRILEQFDSFCTAFRLLGMKYGMMHNDMHTGNVFVDRHTNKLVIIDYGRMTFPDVVIHPAEMHEIEQDEKNRNFWYQNDTYKSLTDKNNKAMKYHPSSDIYFTHVFDFATLMANVQFDITECLENEGETWTWFDSYFTAKSVFGDRLGASVIIPGSYNEIKQNFVNVMKRIQITQGLSDDTKKGLKLLGEGLFFMSWILLYSYQKFIAPPASSSTPKSRARAQLQQQQPSGPIKIELSDLESNNICYYYFQFNNISRMDPMALYNTFLSINVVADKNVIQNSPILKNLMAGKVIGGGRKKPKVSAGTMTATSFLDDDIPLRNNALAKEEDLIFSKLENDKNRKHPSKHIVVRRSAISPTRPVITAPLHTPMVSALAGGSKRKNVTKKNQSNKKE